MKSYSQSQNKIFLKKQIGSRIMTNWTEVKTQTDADSFMKMVNNFHDFYLKEVHIVNPRFMGSPTNAILSFQNTWGESEAFELFFEDVTRINLVPSSANFDSIIMRSLLRLENGSTTWCEDADLWNGKGTNDALTWITAHKLSWRTGSCL
jgi:hypothetical protein